MTIGNAVAKVIMLAVCLVPAMALQAQNNTAQPMPATLPININNLMLPMAVTQAESQGAEQAVSPQMIQGAVNQAFQQWNSMTPTQQQQMIQQATTLYNSLSAEQKAQLFNAVVPAVQPAVGQ